MKDLEILASACKYKPGMLAKARGLSLRQLQRIIRTRFGMTPRGWLRAVRTRVAAELLASGRSVKNAQLQLQYKDAAHFSHDFKRHLGVCPFQYLKAAKATSTSSTRPARIVSARSDENNAA